LVLGVFCLLRHTQFVTQAKKRSAINLGSIFTDCQQTSHTPITLPIRLFIRRRNRKKLPCTLCRKHKHFHTAFDAAAMLIHACEIYVTEA
jgi:hypothetical protein